MTDENKNKEKEEKLWATLDAIKAAVIKTETLPAGGTEKVPVPPEKKPETKQEEPEKKGAVKTVLDWLW